VALAHADDDSQVRQIDLRGCAGMHTRWRRKHTRVRRAARRANVEVTACLYVEYGPKSAGEAAAAAIVALRTQHLFLDMSDEFRSVVISRDTLADHLALMAGEDEAVTVRIRECYTEHASLVSGVAGEDSILIEHTPGGIKGLIRGLSAANRYVVARTGDVRPVRTDAASDQYVFDQDMLAFRRPTQDTGADSISPAPRVGDDVLRKVAEFTRKVSTVGHALRLEWSVADGVPCLLDHSVERVQETSRLGESWVVMSPGTASGTAMVVPTLGDLEYLSDGNLISVDSVDPAVAADHAVKKLLDLARRLSKENSVIVVAERPATVLALLIDVADAFVFEDGALLSHLAILLREAGKPAVVVPGATSLIADGSYVMIAPDGLVETLATERNERADS
jgi:phosphohistidine swiveling domain-containing protein